MKRFMILMLTVICVVMSICGNVAAKENDESNETEGGRLGRSLKAASYIDKGRLVGSITLKDGTVIDIYDDVDVVEAYINVDGFKNPIVTMGRWYDFTLIEINGEYVDLEGAAAMGYFDDVIKLYTKVY